MDIRKAQAQDIDSIEKIVKQYSFEEEREYAEIISSSNKGIFIAEQNGLIVGFLGYKFSNWNKTIEIINIFILSEFRQKGFGSQLIQYLIKFVQGKNYRAIICEAPSKSNAPKLYSKNGFRKCGYNDRYYGNEGREIAEFYSFDLN